MSSKSKNILIVLAITIAIAVGSRIGMFFETEKPKTALKKQGPDYQMTRFEVKEMTNKGTLDNRIKGKSLIHFSATETTEIVEPNMRSYAEKQAPWEVSAMAATYRRGLGEVEFKQNIRMRQDDPSRGITEIKTQKLLVYPENRIAKTDAAVVISINKGKIESTGLIANYGVHRKLEFLHDVKALHAPQN